MAWPLRRQSRLFAIPRTTLQDKIHGRSPDVGIPGPPPVLTKAEEVKLTEFVIRMSRIGYPLTREELSESVKQILDKDGRPNPLHENRPGKDWLHAFLRRNQTISERVPENLGKERAVVTREKIEHWFVEMKKYLVKRPI
jgi:hypothetical protein